MDREKRYSVCVIDDTLKTRETLRSFLGLYCQNVEVAGEAGDVASGLELIRKTSPDLLLLDIEMPDGTGFDLIRKIINNPVKVIFISAHEEYSLDALKFSAVDFILKPVDPYELARAVEKAREQIERDTLVTRFSTLLENLQAENRQNKKVVLKTSDAVHVIQVQDILRCEATDNYTTFYIKNKKPVIVSKTLKEYESMFAGYGFVRSHQSHLVNINYVTSFKKADGGFLVLADESKVPVSSRNRDLVLKTIEKLQG